MGNEKLIPTLPLIVVMRVFACLAFVIQNLFFFVLKFILCISLCEQPAKNVNIMS